MNTEHVVSAPVSVDLSQPDTFATGDGAKEWRLVKMTSTGIALCDSATAPVGVLYRANKSPQVGQSAVGMACDVHLKGANNIFFVQLGATSAAIASGDALQLDSANPGQVVPGGSLLRAWEAAAVTFQGAVIRAVFI